MRKVKRIVFDMLYNPCNLSRADIFEIDIDSAATCDIKHFPWKMPFHIKYAYEVIKLNLSQIRTEMFANDIA